MWIDTRLSRDEIEDEITLRGFKFLGYTYLYDDRREVLDELIFMSRDKEYILWLEWIGGTWSLYKRIKREPPAKWHDHPILPPDSRIQIYASRDYCEDDRGWRWLKVVYRDGKVEYYEYCDGDDVDDGIRLQCDSILPCTRLKVYGEEEKQTERVCYAKQVTLDVWLGGDPRENNR